MIFSCTQKAQVYVLAKKIFVFWKKSLRQLFCKYFLGEPPADLAMHITKATTLL